MNNIEYVTTRRETMIQQGCSKPDIVRACAVACEGWPYVFGAWGEQCTPANRRRRKRDDHPTIVTKCQVLSGKKTTCDGCQWNLPVWMFDCRGFTDKMLSLVGIDLKGEGATSQWNTKANWSASGTIDTLPRDKVCCLFVRKNSKMEHTGLYLGDGSTAEASSGVQVFKKMAGKWTHWALPAGLYDGGDIPTPTPSTDKPTLRRGSTGVYVTLLQSELIQHGYDCGSSGADGVYGAKTAAAVSRWQKDHGLTADGVCGPKTWASIENTPEIQLYTVHIPMMPMYKAEALISQYTGSWMTKEGSDA